MFRKKRIRILRCSNEFYWYLELVGQVVEYDREDKSSYYLNGLGISKADAEKVS